MKIIRTPLDWNSVPDDNWLHSVDYIETADIGVDELESSARTGTVTFTQDESNNEEQVTVIQKRKTFYYSVGTNCGDGTEFRIGGQLVASEDGVATRISTLGDASPETMVAVPKDDIRSLEVSEPSVEFPSSGGSIDEEFTWTNWDKTGDTLPRWPNSTPQKFINSASTSIPSVGSVSGPSWLTVDVDGHITASENAGNERSGTVRYSYCGKTATVHVTQKEKLTLYFAVKTTSTLAQGKRMTFTVNGVDVDKNFQVGAGACEGYFTASVSATSDSEVSASCNFSYTMITAVPSALTFASTGETLTVDVDAGIKSLIVDHQPLTGYTNLDSASKFYTIEENATTGQYFSEIVSGEGFSISANSITASPNTTHSTRTGKAKFTLATDTAYTATVTLNQPNVNWFSFKSTVSGSPNAGSVIFSNLPAPYPSSEAIPYTQQTGDTQYLEKTYTGNVQQISYKIEGFEETASISVDRDYVEFSFTMEKFDVGTVDSPKYVYRIMGTTEDVVVTADGTSYAYQEKINEQIVSPPSLTGVIPANSELEFNATASTANDFTITKTYNNSTSGDWECNVATGTPTTVTVKTIGPIPIASQKILTLKYTLDEAPEITAQTKFVVPTGATSNIDLENLRLSSYTAFAGAMRSNGNQVPTGMNAYTFVFWPPTRTAPSMNVRELEYNINYADIRYNKPTSDYNGWMLYYPLNKDSATALAPINNMAKVYALTYGLGVTHGEWGQPDSWYLGPLMYKGPSDYAYYEVDGFKFLPPPGSATTNDGFLKIVSTGIKEGETGHSKTYPSTCPFSGSWETPLSASSAYFGFANPAHGPSSATSGTIINSGRQIVIAGQAVGGLPATTGSTTGTNKNFYERVRPMIERNWITYHNTAATTNCSTQTYNTRSALAEVVSGSLLTNILGPIMVRLAYCGRYGTMEPDVPSTGSTWHIPADSYTVSPINPGDTTSVIYDAETNSYVIYNIDNVVVVNVASHIVVPPEDLENYQRPIEGGIIQPIGP